MPVPGEKVKSERARNNALTAVDRTPSGDNNAQSILQTVGIMTAINKTIEVGEQSIIIWNPHIIKPWRELYSISNSKRKSSISLWYYVKKKTPVLIAEDFSLRDFAFAVFVTIHNSSITLLLRDDKLFKILSTMTWKIFQDGAGLLHNVIYPNVYSTRPSFIFPRLQWYIVYFSIFQR